MTTFADLDTAAANYDGTLWRLPNGANWTYPTGVRDPLPGAIAPRGSVPDARVQAALAVGVYVARVIDQGRVVAVVAAPTDGSTLVPTQAAELGSWAGAPATNVRPQPTEAGNAVPLYASVNKLPWPPSFANLPKDSSKP